MSVRFYDTGTQNTIASVYERAIQEGADFIIGPSLKDQVAQLLRTQSIKTTTLALNYTNSRRPAHFYEIGLLPEDEVTQMVNYARKKGLSRALVIAPQSRFGSRLSQPLLARWQEQGGQVVDTLYFGQKTNFSAVIPQFLHVNVTNDKELMRTDRTKENLENQRRHDFDVIFLLTNPRDARTIVPLLRYYYVGRDTPIYATSSLIYRT